MCTHGLALHRVHAARFVALLATQNQNLHTSSLLVGMYLHTSELVRTCHVHACTAYVRITCVHTSKLVRA